MNGPITLHTPKNDLHPLFCTPVSPASHHCCVGTILLGPNTKKCHSTRTSYAREPSNPASCDVATLPNQVCIPMLLSQVSMFMLGIQGEGHLSAGVKRAIASAVLQQFIMLPGDVSSSGTSTLAVPAVSVPSSSGTTGVLLSSNSTGFKHASVLLMAILASLEPHIPLSQSPATLKAVAAAAQHCRGRSGQNAFDSCRSFELQFLLDTLVRQFGSKPPKERDHQQVW